MVKEKNTCAGKMDSIRPENMVFQAAAVEAPVLTSGVPGSGRLLGYSVSVCFCNAKQENKF